MTVEDLVAEVEELTGLEPEKAKRAVYAVLYAMIKALRDEDEVVVHGFGRFSFWTRPARYFGLPKTEAGRVMVYKPNEKRIKFQPSKAVLHMLNPEEYKEI